MENRIKGFLSGHKGSLFALVMFLFFLLVIIFAKDIRLLVVNTTVDARFWPRIIGIGGCALSILLFVQSLLEERKRDGGVDVKEEEMDPDDKTRSIKTLLLMFLYILGLEYLGFVIMTLLYLFLQILVLTERDEWNYKKFLVIDLVFTFAVFVIFRYGFKMMLPTGDFVNMLGRLV